MIINARQWHQPLTDRFFVISCLALRIAFLFSLLRPLNEFPLGPNTIALLPIDSVLNFFPSSMGEFLYSKIFELFQNHYQAIGSSLVLVSLFKPLRTISFLFLSLFCFIFTERFFILGHIGDYLYCFLFFHLSLVLVSKNQKNESYITLLDLAPLILLRTVIYAFNIWNKVNSSWGTGGGFSQSLKHTELSRFPEVVSLFPTLTIVLNYVLILVLIFAVMAPFISLKYPKTRFFFSLLCIAYHFGGICFFRLDGISIPFIILEVMLLTQPLGIQSSEFTNPLRKRTILAAVILVLGFFNITPRGSHFERPFNLPMGHNWYMFAPPPPVTAEWSFAIKSKDSSEILLTQTDIETKLKIPQGIRSYKYFYNLRRIDAFPFVEHLLETLCQDSNYVSIKTRYAGTILESKAPFEKSWPEYSCD